MPGLVKIHLLIALSNCLYEMYPQERQDVKGSKYIRSNQMTIMTLVMFARQCFAKDGLPNEGKGNVQSICIPDSIKGSLECCAQS